MHKYECTSPLPPPSLCLVTNPNWLHSATTEPPQGEDSTEPDTCVLDATARIFGSGAGKSSEIPVDPTSTSLVDIPDGLEEMGSIVMVDMDVQEEGTEGPVAVMTDNREDMCEEDRGYSAQDGAGRCSNGADRRNEPGAVCDLLGKKEVNNNIDAAGQGERACSLPKMFVCTLAIPVMWGSL